MRTAPTVLLLMCLVAAPAFADGLKDPTRPPAVVAPATHAALRPALPRVSAIFMADDRRVAIFEDQPVRVGDRVGLYRIDDISATGVRYSTAGRSAFAALATPP